MVNSAKAKQTGLGRLVLGIAMTLLSLTVVARPNLNKTWHAAVENYENIRLGYQLERRVNELQRQAP